MADFVIYQNSCLAIPEAGPAALMQIAPGKARYWRRYKKTLELMMFLS
jgi:hypothetical protein